MDLRTPGDIVRHAIAMERARPGPQPGGNQTPPPARTMDPPQREVPTPRQQEKQPSGSGGEGESLLQRILRLAGAGPICGGTPPSTPRVPSPSRTLSSTSEAEILETSEVEVQEVQYDETNADQNEQMALRPKARPLRRDPRHGAMAATGGDGGRDGHGDRDDPRRNDRASPEPEAEDNEEDSVEETGTQEFMYRMKRRSGELTGRKNKFQVGKSSAWEPQKLRKGRGHTVRWWPERRGKGSRGEESTITHSVTSPTTGWQRIYAKGKQPRALRVSNQGGKGSGGRIVMQGKGTNPAAELQLAQSMSRAAAAIWRAESAVSTHGNGSEGAEAAYDEAAEAVSQFLEADAVLHPPTGASSSSAAPSSSNAAPVGRGAANLGLEVYRDFLQTKGKGKGKTSRAHADAAADEEGSDQEADPEDENYEEEIEEEEEEEQGDDGDYVEVELEVIPEEDHDGHDAAEGPTTEDQEDAGHEDVGWEEGTHDGNGHASNGEEERHGDDEDDPNYNDEEEFVQEEHS